MKSSCLRLAAVAVALMMLGGAAVASITTTDPSLPPLDGVYISASDVHTTYNIPGVIEVLLERPEHAAIVVRERLGLLGTNTEQETFDSTLNGNGVVTVLNSTIVGVPEGVYPVSFNSSGPVTTNVHNKIGNTTGTFDTEMISMMLTGASPLGPFMIRESPTLASLGSTSITDLGGGSYHIDSFFDVFTELSIDGGASWIPSAGPTHVTLVPEPGSVTLLGIGVLGLAGLVWRKRRAA